jgi:hypothetical protein
MTPKGDTMSQKYNMIRVKAETHARLVAERDRMYAAYQAGQLDLPDDQADHLSLDYVLNRLLDRREDHGRRRATAQQKARRGTRVYTAPVQEAKEVVA